MHTVDIQTSLIEKNSKDYDVLAYLVANQNNNSKQTSIKIKVILFDWDKERYKAKDKRFAIFILSVDCLKLLHKTNVENSEDIKKIKDRLNKFLSSANMAVDDFHMRRIDYCDNMKYRDENERDCIFELLKKASPKVNYLAKNGYPNGIRYFNKSRVYMVYDKIKERQKFGKEPKLYENFVIRVEYQMKDRVIKAYKAKGKPDTFDEWMDLDEERKFLKDGRKIFTNAEYCNRTLAEKRISDSGYSPELKHNLIAYIEDVAASDMHTVAKKHSNDTIKRYIKMLVDINVNPVTIDDKWGIERLKSPIR